MTDLDRFREAIPRYFAGDLDRVEARWFERQLEVPDCKQLFESEYDARLESAGLAALTRSDPDLVECFSFDTLQRYARGRLERADHALVEAHAGCPLCGPQIEALGLQEAAQPLVLATVVAWLRRVLQPGPALALAGAALLVLLVLPILPRQDHDFVPRGGLEQAWRGVGVEYVLDGKPLEAGARIPPDGRIQVKYSALERSAPTFLAVFAIDAGGAVRWYHPAREDRAAEQRSMPVENGAHDKSAGPSTAHDLPEGSLTLVALFTSTPLSVRAIEARVATASTSLGLDDVEEKRLTVEVGR